MSRLVKKDFSLLKEYIKGYDLSDSMTDSYIKSIKPLHKSYLILIALVGELLEAHNNDNLNINKNSAMHLSECLSDVGESIFCWIHGAYKPSMLISRSSIENFIKSTSCTTEPNILKEKSVYKIFDIASGIKEFSYNSTKTNFDRIHSEYKRLCKYVHTATESNMSKIGSLAHFPSFDTKLSNETSTQLYELNRCYANVLSALYYDAFVSFHHTNKSLIMEFIHSDVKDVINGATPLNS